MIYLDTSVALAHLFAEDRRLPAAIWDETIVSSRLLEYELWTRVHARGLADSHGEDVRTPLGRLGFLELLPLVLTRRWIRSPSRSARSTRFTWHRSSFFVLVVSGSSWPPTTHACASLPKRLGFR